MPTRQQRKAIAAKKLDDFWKELWKAIKKWLHDILHPPGKKDKVTSFDFTII